MKVIAVDYDNTYTDIPELLESFMQAAKNAGHLVFIVTFRNENDPRDKIDIGWEVFYTNGQPKADYMNSCGIEVDIWIDDYPELIGRTH